MVDINSLLGDLKSLFAQYETDVESFTLHVEVDEQRFSELIEVLSQQVTIQVGSRMIIYTTSYGEDQWVLQIKKNN